jgi:hypothetical protein
MMPLPAQRPAQLPRGAVCQEGREPQWLPFCRQSGRWLQLCSASLSPIVRCAAHQADVESRLTAEFHQGSALAELDLRPAAQARAARKACAAAAAQLQPSPAPKANEVPAGVGSEHRRVADADEPGVRAGAPAITSAALVTSAEANSATAVHAVHGISPPSLAPDNPAAAAPAIGAALVSQPPPPPCCQARPGDSEIPPISPFAAPGPQRDLPAPAAAPPPAAALAAAALLPATQSAPSLTPAPPLALSDPAPRRPAVLRLRCILRDPATGSLLASALGHVDDTNVPLRRPRGAASSSAQGSPAASSGGDRAAASAAAASAGASAGATAGSAEEPHGSLLLIEEAVLGYGAFGLVTLVSGELGSLPSPSPPRRSHSPSHRTPPLPDSRTRACKALFEPRLGPCFADPRLPAMH